jgi:hypothetical protein
MYGTLSAAPLAVCTATSVGTRVVLGRDHCAGAVGHAQAGAQVTRIGDTVEQQQRHRRLHRIEQVLERQRRRGEVDDRDHPLVALAGTHPGDARAVDEVRSKAGVVGDLHQFAHPRVLTRSASPHAPGRRSQANTEWKPWISKNDSVVPGRGLRQRPQPGAAGGLSTRRRLARARLTLSLRRRFAQPRAPALGPARWRSGRGVAAVSAGGDDAIAVAPARVPASSAAPRRRMRLIA